MGATRAHRLEAAMRTVRDVMRRDIEVLSTTESAADAACFLAVRTRIRSRSASPTGAWPGP